MKKITFFVSVLAILSLGACQWGKSTDTKPTNNEQTAVTEKNYTEADIRTLGDEILNLLKDKDFESLSLKIHPEMGIRFSPYAHVNNEDLHFSADDFLAMVKKNETLLWGYADGSGFEMNFTFEEYHQKYIYDHNYLTAPEILVNTEKWRGNIPNNSFEFYPNSHVIEYHFEGFEEQYLGMDWSSLRLIFMDYNGQLYLVGIAHDEWTI